MIEFLEIFFFGKGNVQMADPLSAMAVGSLVTGGIQLFSGIFGGGAARRKEKAATGIWIARKTGRRPINRQCDRQKRALRINRR